MELFGFFAGLGILFMGLGVMTGTPLIQITNKSDK